MRISIKLLLVVAALLVLSVVVHTRRNETSNQGGLRRAFRRLRKFRNCLAQRWSVKSKYNCVKRAKKLRLVRKCVRKVRRNGTPKKQRFSGVMKCVAGKFRKVVRKIYGKSFGTVKKFKKVVLKCEVKKCDRFEGRKRFGCVSKCVKKYLRRQSKRARRALRKEKRLGRIIKVLKKKLKKLSKVLKKTIKLKSKLRNKMTNAVQKRNKLKQKRLQKKANLLANKKQRVTTIVVKKEISPFALEDEVRLYMDVVKDVTN